MRRRPGIGGLQTHCCCKGSIPFAGRKCGKDQNRFDEGAACHLSLSARRFRSQTQGTLPSPSSKTKSDRGVVSEDDCLRAISKLKVLGSGFEVISVGKKKLVRSVPTELNKDHNEILELAQAQGFVTVNEVERRLSWSSGRAIDALDTLLDEGLAMIDDGHRDGKRRYWFPCVSPISSSIVVDS
ncbi:Vacuolar protein sorting-associated protein 2 1 [Spatholobus suberectus]|nr:Vacuolar protein sorting-associated protein 2 1 [Spatholobus suberectus]